MPRPGRITAAALAVVGAALGWVAGCSAPAPPPELGPTRGYVLISLDTLGARHLGAYGAEDETSPFFDRLAGEGTLFEHAFVQYPSTLVSHVSMFTGLYPQEHGVYPPSSVLSPAIASLPERFRAAGFRTAGFTEGGYVSRDFGFDRGFDEFVAGSPIGRRQAEKTFELGARFLRGLTADERFFLFLHTYAVHDPYHPPPPWDGSFWPGDRPDAPDSSGSFLRDVNMGRHTVSEETVAFYRAQYRAEIRYLDEVLAGFFAELEALGLRGETTVVVTSDHGEEFFEHGKLAHSQVYPENLHVPLLVLHPDGRPGARVGELVESVDLAPTLYELAGIEPPSPTSGRSLVPLLGGGGADPDGSAYAEVYDQENQKTLIRAEGGRILQYATALVIPEPGGTWVAHRAVFDTEEPRLELELVSFHRPRDVAIAVDGEPRAGVRVGTGWQPLVLDLPGDAGRHRVELATAGCDVPMWLDLGPDTRCLSLKIRGVELRRSELYDLSVDPVAATDLSRRHARLHARLGEELRRHRWEVVAAPESQELSDETVESLRALGYIK